MAGRATPNKIMSYKLALQLYRTFNDQTPTQDWLNMNQNIILSSRQSKFSINKSCRLKVGMNVLSNRFNFLNSKIDFNWLNLSYESYKIKCKRIFLSWTWVTGDLIMKITATKFHCSTFSPTNNYWLSRVKNDLFCMPQLPSGSVAITNCQAHLLANLNIPSMYNFILWNNFLIKNDIYV